MNRPFEDLGLPLAAMDWAEGRVHYSLDGETVQSSAGGLEYLISLPPHRIVSEPAFKNVTPKQRDEIILKMREAGHQFLLFRDTQTARRRKTMTPWLLKKGFKLYKGNIKGNEVDTLVIWNLASDGKTVLSPAKLSTEVDRTWKKKVLTLSKKAKKVRVSYTRSGRKEIGGVLVSELSALGKKYLANAAGKEFLTGVSTLALVALNTSGREEYERALGKYQNGWSSTLRSDVYHWIWATARKRPDTNLREFTLAIRAFRHLVISRTHRNPASARTLHNPLVAG